MGDRLKKFKFQNPKFWYPPTADYFYSPSPKTMALRLKNEAKLWVVVADILGNVAEVTEGLNSINSI